MTAFLVLVGFGLGAYLTYLELAVIHAIYQWCVASAAARRRGPVRVEPAENPR